MSKLKSNKDIDDLNISFISREALSSSKHNKEPGEVESINTFYVFEENNSIDWVTVNM